MRVIHIFVFGRYLQKQIDVSSLIRTYRARFMLVEYARAWKSTLVSEHIPLMCVHPMESQFIRRRETFGA
jgi:hypothetical protein